MVKAESVDQMYRVFKGAPLSLEELDDYYVDATQARGADNPRQRMARLLRRNIANPVKLLFVGYKGCGKSTELNHLHRDLQQDFLVVNFSVLQEMDTNRLSHTELFIVTMERLFDAVDAHGLGDYVSEGYLKAIKAWIQQKEIEEIREKYNISGEIAAGAGIDIPFLKAFFAKLKFSAKTSASLKETIKTQLEPKLSDLIDYCNDLVREVQKALQEVNKKDILIVIEDLDKVPLSEAQSLFFDHIHQLTLLKTHVIYTFPIALYHSIRFNAIKAYFTDLKELPMIKVANKDGSVNLEGSGAMREIVAQRCDLRLFESGQVLQQMIMDSGGCLRDLFLMIYEAAENALDEDQSTVNHQHRHSAFQKLKREYDNSIAEYRENDQLFTVDQYYDALVSLAQSSDKKPENTEVVMHLRQSLAILGYNGEGWCEVHPIVRAILVERGKI
ncbi:MAG: hypothetical protein AAF804_07650 [Bacteroidota bacterium]